MDSKKICLKYMCINIMFSSVHEYYIQLCRFICKWYRNQIAKGVGFPRVNPIWSCLGATSRLLKKTSEGGEPLLHSSTVKMVRGLNVPSEKLFV